MIGVIADPSDHGVVREFFELFKTPWEFYRDGRQYQVVLCSTGNVFESTANLILFYAGRKTPTDDVLGAEIGGERQRPCTLAYGGSRVPIYGDTVTFSGPLGTRVLTDQESGECLGFSRASNGGTIARLGYDLFSEVRILLTTGQPAANAGAPALELHIALLRDAIVESGVLLAEIPPVPDGFRCVVCLTHDVDHPSIRRHKFDHAVFGFLYRATFGSLKLFLTGRMPVRDLLSNWAAALKLPFVYLGLASDFWGEFDKRYLEIEGGLPSTFFVIPFANTPGRRPEGIAPAFRAARYGARDIEAQIRNLGAAGCEVGLHGIDAWLDASRGHEELEEVWSLSSASAGGVRMHWLYFGEKSHAVLEKAGAVYDSTVGYNETVGYRAGATQVFKPLAANQLLELPLHVMDTALFYPAHLGLSPQQAKTILAKMLDNVTDFGGVLTINWHDRSLAPERLWYGSYRDLIRDLKDRGAWFSTAGQAVSWFRKRRSASFEEDFAEPGGVRVKLTTEPNDNVPGLRLRIYNPPSMQGTSSTRYTDVAIEPSVQMSTAQAGR